MTTQYRIISHYANLTEVQRTSILTGKMNSMFFDKPEDEFHQYFENRGKDGILIQDRFPDLSIVEREFLISGMLPSEQTKFYGE